MDKQGMEFWIFSLEDPELFEFYGKRQNYKKLYYAVLIERLPDSLPEYVIEVLHLRKGAVLLLPSYLLPLYYRIGIDGYAIIMSEEFCLMDEYKALLRVLFFHIKPEGVVDMGQINRAQKECIDLASAEYASPYDELQPSVIRNALANLVLQSDVVNVETQLKSGHLLTIAIQLVELIDKSAFVERKKSFYAQKLAITEKLLDTALKVIYDKTFREVLNNRIIVDAMYMLAFTNKSVNQIAHELNYDASDFSRLFIKYKGRSPREVKETLRKVVDYVQNGY